METTDRAEGSPGRLDESHGATQSAARASRAGGTVMEDRFTPQPPEPKRRMIITHDKYMTLQSLIVLHLSATERETGRGIDRDELVDWYLELKESEIQDIEELEYEKELITKMLRKLVKVSLLRLMFPSLMPCYVPRTIILLKSRGTYRNHYLLWTMTVVNLRFCGKARMYACTIWSIRL